MSIDGESLIVWSDMKLKFFFWVCHGIMLLLNVMGDSMEIHSSKYKSHYSRFDNWKEFATLQIAYELGLVSLFIWDISPNHLYIYRLCKC